MAKKVILITAISFAVFFYIDDLFFKTIRQQLNGPIGQLGISRIFAYTLVGIPGLILKNIHKTFLMGIK